MPLAVFLSYLFGEHRRSKLSELVDLMELAEKYKHLRLHQWSVVPFHILDYYLIENKNTKITYDCPTYLISMSFSGIITKVKHKNEKAAREALSQEGIKLIERDPYFAELL